MTVNLCATFHCHRADIEPIIKGPLASCAAAWIDPTTMAHARHTTKVFDSDLQELARVVAEMGGLAERQIAEAIEALAMRDSGRAQRIIAGDRCHAAQH